MFTFGTLFSVARVPRLRSFINGSFLAIHNIAMQELMSFAWMPGLCIRASWLTPKDSIQPIVGITEVQQIVESYPNETTPSAPAALWAEIWHFLCYPSHRRDAHGRTYSTLSSLSWSEHLLSHRLLRLSRLLRNF